jgi:hypothetical protein
VYGAAWNLTFPEAEFLDEIQKMSEEFSSLFITVTSTALPCDLYFFTITQSLTVSVKEKGGNPDRKPYPHAYGFRIHTETWELSTLCPETSMKLFVHDSASGQLSVYIMIQGWIVLRYLTDSRLNNTESSRRCSVPLYLIYGINTRYKQILVGTPQVTRTSYRLSFLSHYYS